MKAWRVSVCAVLAAVNAQAAVVAAWDVAGVLVSTGQGIETNLPPYQFLATSNGSARATARLALGAGVNPSTAVDRYGFKISAAHQTNSLAGAIAKNHYMELSVMVDQGYAINLDSLRFNGESTGAGCSDVALMSSIDGFADGLEIASVSQANKTGGFDTADSGFGAPIDLSAPKYQSLAGTVSFRLYGWNSTSGSSTTYFRNLSGDDLILYGEVVALPGRPSLSISRSEGQCRVEATFHGASGPSHVLQSCMDLSSNTWSTVSAPFSSDTGWDVDTAGPRGFFRAEPL